MANFTPRLSSSGISGSKYYYNDNPFYQSGYGMPNCTAYAWGRFYEILGTKPTLSLGNAEDWYAYSDKYERGVTPRLGAVICWRRGNAGNNSDGAGHVAIVEVINSDGSIVTSESGWNSDFFWTTTRYNDGNWGASSAYTFQGFIYNPAVVDVNMPTNWITRNGYLTKAEMENNVLMAWQYFGSRGWSREAVSAMAGNWETESTINPGIWESLVPYGGGMDWCSGHHTPSIQIGQVQAGKTTVTSSVKESYTKWKMGYSGLVTLQHQLFHHLLALESSLQVP